MIFRWLRRRRRKRILTREFPAGWERILEQNVAHYLLLNEPEQATLRGMVQIFVAEKHWEGLSSLEIDDEIKVTIAGQACLLLIGLDDEYFDRLQSILVYPGTYVAQETIYQPGGVVIETASPRSGEAWNGGPVVLSWPSVLADGRAGDSGQNVVLHEFAHVLDMQDHGIDGTPPLENSSLYRSWHDVMTGEYRRLIRHSSQGRATLLDHYGALSEAEFFAVATECFFERPIEMAEEHPRLYELLRGFYHQDPAARLQQANGN